jgi:hypothetical protein
MTEVNFLVKKGLTVPKGSASTPSVIFDASDPNTGLYSPGADQVAVATNGTGRLFVDASGRIGIAGSPSASSNTYLQVGYAGIGSDHVAYNYDSYFANNLYKSANSAWSRISTRAGGLLRIEDDTFTYSTADSGTAGASATLSERLRITSAGLVGIGTSSPYRVESGNNHIWMTGAIERARIDSSGRLLVGTSSTSKDFSAVFQGNSADATGGANLLLARGTSSPADGSAIGYLSFTDSNHNTAALIQAQRDGGTWDSGASQPGRLVFSTTANGASAPTERMRINAVGALKASLDGTYESATSSYHELRTQGSGDWIAYFTQSPSLLTALLYLRPDHCHVGT